MKFKFPRGFVWIPSIMALAGRDNLELIKTKNNKSLKVKSSSKQYVKNKNQGKSIRTRFYTRNK